MSMCHTRSAQPWLLEGVEPRTFGAKARSSNRSTVGQLFISGCALALKLFPASRTYPNTPSPALSTGVTIIYGLGKKLGWGDGLGRWAGAAGQGGWADGLGWGAGLGLGRAGGLGWRTSLVGGAVGLGWWAGLLFYIFTL